MSHSQMLVLATSAGNAAVLFAILQPDFHGRLAGVEMTHIFYCALSGVGFCFNCRSFRLHFVLAIDARTPPIHICG